jgi:hypothetical protein
VSPLGTVIVGALLLITAFGVVLVATSFARQPMEDSDVPMAQVVGEGRSPRLPRRRLQVSMGRLAFGVVLLVFGGAGVMFIYAAAGLAQMANH